MRNKNFIQRTILVLFFMLLVWHPVFLFSDTFTVENTMDTGAGSLRQAMTDADSRAGADTIVFNIPVTDSNYNATLGVWTIRPNSALPELTTDSTFINGGSQSLFIGIDTNPAGPEIELDGSNAGTCEGLLIKSSYNSIRGLVINRFEQFGIHLFGGQGDVVNYNIVAGNFVGTDATGTTDMGNGFSGILLYSGPKHNNIGGTSPEERNLVSGNGWSGIELQGSNVDSNLVIGNYIGTDVTGTENLGNDHNGVNIWSFAKYNIIGGTLPGERNIISGNGWSGVSIGHHRSSNNKIINNYIGMDVNGTSALPNGANGIGFGGDSTIVGGELVGSGNLISSNSGCGIEIGGCRGSIIAQNIIGLDISGTIAFPNRNKGIFVWNGAVNNTIGPENLIHFSKADGITIDGTGTIGNMITQNSITESDSMGINNVDGGNNEIPPPLILGIYPITGTTVPNARVEIFSDISDEGRVFEDVVFSDGAGNFTWAGTPEGPFVTATVMDADSNTSEFSAPVLTLLNYSVSGNINYYSSSNPVQGVNLNLNGLSAITDLAGEFSFPEVPAGSYDLIPDKTGELATSISAFDASKILQYNVGLIGFNPYELIAADVTGNDAITAYDAAFILQYVAGIITEFPVAADWFFVPVDYPINETNWYLAPNFISYSPLSANETDQNFYGIIHGDVTGNWLPMNLAFQQKNYTGTATLKFGEIRSTRGQDISVPLMANVNGEFLSAVVDICFNETQLKLKNISPGDKLGGYTVVQNCVEGKLKIVLAGFES
ncbi:hypothetical protein B6I21_03940, partial [candidate division KSB1 bacterium 4572_119]